MVFSLSYFLIYLCKVNIPSKWTLPANSIFDVMFSLSFSSKVLYCWNLQCSLLHSFSHPLFQKRFLHHWNLQYERMLFGITRTQKISAFKNLIEEVRCVNMNIKLWIPLKYGKWYLNGTDNKKKTWLQCLERFSWRIWILAELVLMGGI